MDDDILPVCVDATPSFAGLSNGLVTVQQVHQRFLSSAIYINCRRPALTSSQVSHGFQAFTLLTKHTRFSEWAQRYGALFSLKIGPATAVVVSSPALVKKLIDQRSNIYSARPPSYVSHDLITKGDHLLIMTNDEKWKLFRKLVHQTFNQTRCEKEHITLQDAEAVQMMKDFCDEPEKLMSHPKRFSNSIVMSVGKRLISALGLIAMC